MSVGGHRLGGCWGWLALGGSWQALRGGPSQPACPPLLVKPGAAALSEVAAGGKMEAERNVECAPHLPYHCNCLSFVLEKQEMQKNSHKWNSI